MSDTSYPHPFGSYVLLEHLGRGGMADVELARRVVDDARFIRFVVIKRIQTKHATDQNFVRMFTDEARISAELQQENIAQVYDFGQVGEEYFLAMEYVPGVNLRHVQRILASRGQVPPFRVTFRILADVLSALQYAHARVDTYGRPMNLVHRDVNPRNVMLSVRGEVKLIDFGVAKADIRAEHTVGKSMKGKFAYMAPEQVESTSPVDGRTDLFAVGLVLHELVAGRSPYAGMNEAQIVHQTISGPIPLLKVPALYPDATLLRAIHDRALAKLPDDRYPDASAMREDIVRAASCVGGLASREEMAEFLRKVAPEDVYQITERLKTYRDVTPPPVSAATSRPPPEQPEVKPRGDDAPTIVPSEPVRPQVPAQDRHPLAWVLILALAILGGSAFVLALLLPGRQAATGANEVAAAPERGTEAASPAESALESAPPLSSAPEQPESPAAPEQPPPSAGTRAKRSSVVSASSPTRTAAPEGTPAAEVAEGFLNVSSAPERGFQVYVDGVRVGETPLKAWRVPVGAHKVEIRDEATGRLWERKVTVSEGKAAVVTTRSAP